MQQKTRKNQFIENQETLQIKIRYESFTKQNR